MCLECMDRLERAVTQLLCAQLSTSSEGHDPPSAPSPGPKMLNGSSVGDQAISRCFTRQDRVARDPIV